MEIVDKRFIEIYGKVLESELSFNRTPFFKDLDIKEFISRWMKGCT